MKRYYALSLFCAGVAFACDPIEDLYFLRELPRLQHEYRERQATQLVSYLERIVQQDPSETSIDWICSEVKRLVEEGSSPLEHVGADSLTALHIAVRQPHLLPVVELLLNNTTKIADPSSRNSRGESALDEAVIAENNQAVERLLQDRRTYLLFAPACLRRTPTQLALQKLQEHERNGINSQQMHLIYQMLQEEQNRLLEKAGLPLDNEHVAR